MQRPCQIEEASGHCTGKNGNWQDLAVAMWQLLQCQWVCVRPHDRRSHSVTRHQKNQIPADMVLYQGWKRDFWKLKSWHKANYEGGLISFIWVRVEMRCVYSTFKNLLMQTQSLSSAWTRRWRMFFCYHLTCYNRQTTA